MRARHAIVAVIAVLALAGGCGGDEAGDEAAPPTTNVETAPRTTTEETTPAPPAPQARQIVIVVDRGRPRGGIKRPEVKQGSTLVLVVRADIGESVHIHGYDIEKPITPGKPVRIPMTTKLPGRFEVELHHPDALLAVLTVRP